ncbi:hypothetical protein CDAR_525861 [Caerostris darwini]|uniref:Uncharacterized protein n=1 Tax=Caerostris darwini TaxID=1538125 RepID=A0AAV4S4U6_9ARAC|nr:hypothetical protein CDAR_525861 [Caerostris darwini]
MAVTSINSEWVDNGESLLFHALFEENFRSNPDGIWWVIMRFCVFHKSPDFDEKLTLLIKNLPSQKKKQKESYKHFQNDEFQDLTADNQVHNTIDAYFP